MSLFDLKLPLACGGTLDMQSLQGRVLLIVNTATGCGFIRQLDMLAQLHQNYQAQGFSLIAAPCNQFSEQEPLDNAQLCDFFQQKYGGQFPVLEKQNVDGLKQSELYRQLYQADLRRIKLFPFIPWNFTKLLINREGQLIKRFVPVKPVSQVEKAVQVIL
jgi:glutathione peroxidase